MPTEVWRHGIQAVIIFITAILFGVAGADVYFEARRVPPVGERLQAWARRYPLISGGLILLMGAMMAHFFLNNGW